MTIARYIDFRVLGDQLGWLVSLEGGRNIPFEIRRTYYIFGTRAGVTRGRHAHRRLRQVMVCLAGSCDVMLDDGKTQETVHLDRNDAGLVLDPMVWHEMSSFSPGCVLLVLADAWYDESDYIRDYREFERLARAGA